jgi:hypothetical protein
MKIHESQKDYDAIEAAANVGRASVPAGMGRRGGRPYVSVRAKFLF